jgi:hypothetical protein
MIRSIKFSISFVACLFALLACEEDSAVQTEPHGPENQALKDTILIIGTYYGMCFPPESCVHVYQIAGGKVYADTTYHYPYDGNGYKFKVLLDTAYPKVKQLKAAFPLRILTDTTTEFGCPDCRDQGGYYVALNADGYQQEWLIDKDLDAVSPYLHPFLQKVDSAVQELP